MEKQFVSYEIALRLKELGFDEACICLYRKYINSIRFFAIDQNWGCSLSGMCKKYGDKIEENECLAPLWQQVIDWLETKGYYINITRVFQWNPLPIEFSGWCIYIGTENPEETLECNSYYVSHYYPTKQEAYEQAVLKALELCQKEK